MEKAALEALHGKYLEMMKDFAAFCEENGIVYFLDSGTLLGAARHQGFIPWDDDVDFFMDVKNYRRLLKLRDRLPPQFFLQNFRTDPKIGNKWSTLRLNGTTAMPKQASGYDVHFGIGADIFPVYSLAKTELGRRVQTLADSLMNTLLYKDWAEAWGKPVSGRLRVLYALLPGKLRIWALALLEHIVMRDTQRGDKVMSLYYTLSQDVGFLPGSLMDPAKSVTLPFEDTAFPCSGEYEKLLVYYYGENWRTPLPPEERVDHADYILDLEHDYREYKT